jgi:cell division protein FtsZ
MSSIEFQMPKNKNSIIKVIGVGGGGGNAVNNMYRKGIIGVDFIVCNTDLQALEMSPVPNKIRLGATHTEGLGAGANPDIGRLSAVESLEQLRDVLKTNTKMVFVTAGMGGGTGTGAAPVIAGLAKEMGILTVAIVTTPFRFEGKKRMGQALAGIKALESAVDTIVTINNDNLTEVFGKNVTMKQSQRSSPAKVTSTWTSPT